jgi:hypothetical protein
LRIKKQETRLILHEHDDDDDDDDDDDIQKYRQSTDIQKTCPNMTKHNVT